MLQLLAVLLALPYVVVRAVCPPCDLSECPLVCLDPVPDPCGCCPIRCANSEGDYCSEVEPCSRDLVCTNTTFGGNRCLCRLDKRMVCGSNNFTYNSICHMNSDNKSSDVSIQHWGPCEFGPKIQSGPTNTRAELGTPTALDCEAKGSPVPTIVWTFTGKNGVTTVLPGDDPQVAIQVRGGPEQLMATSWVQIVDARPENEGSYVCEARSKLGSVSAEATLLVRPPL